MKNVAPVFASEGSELLITKVKLPGGWLSNMSPHPVSYEGKRWRTCEALFQALRLEDEDAKEVIRKESSPMAAKMVPKTITQIWSHFRSSFETQRNCEGSLNANGSLSDSVARVRYEILLMD